MLPLVKKVRLHTLLTGAIVALASTFLGCEFGSPPALKTPEEVLKILHTAPLISLSEGDRWTVYEDPVKIRVQHGYGCAQVSEAATESYIGFVIEDGEVAPDVNDRGAIILNGWDVQYPNGDHHVLGLGSVIFNISHRHNGPSEYTLQWQAGEVLSDRDGDDGYKWCYRYTLLFWNPSVLDAQAFQDVQFDESTTFVGKSQANDPDMGEIIGKFTIPDEKDSPRAALPRGFGQLWTDDDHHVLQAAFDLGPLPWGAPSTPPAIPSPGPHSQFW